MSQEYVHRDWLIQYTPNALLLAIRKLLTNRDIKPRYSKVEITTLEKDLLVITIETKIGTIRNAFELQSRKMGDVSFWLSELWEIHIDRLNGLFITIDEDLP